MAKKVKFCGASIISPAFAVAEIKNRKVIKLPDQETLPQQQAHPPDIQQADAPKNAKVFGLTKLGFSSFDALIQESAQELNVEYELLFSNMLGTQHGYMKVVGGKVAKTLPLIEFSVQSSVPVIRDGIKLGYIVKHFKRSTAKMVEEFICIDCIKKHKCCENFGLPPQGKKKLDDLCERMVESLIIEKADLEKPIEVGSKQGWRMISENYGLWESRGRYPSVIRSVISDSINLRETPRTRTKIYTADKDQRWKFNDIFTSYPDLKTPFLLRESTYFLTFANKFGVHWDQIIEIKPNDRAAISMLTALFDNVSYGRGHILALSNGKGIVRAGETLNDAVLLISDDSKADEERKRDSGISELHKKVLDARGEFLQIPILLSGYASSQLRPDLYCDFSGLNGGYAISPAVLCEVLEYHDHNMLTKIENRFSDFLEVYNRHMGEVSLYTPHFIPPQRRNIYYVLLATLRAYDEYFGEFFGDETENHIIELLSSYNEVGSSNDELLLTLFGNCINEEIGSGRFNYIKRTKFIVIDQGNNSVIVDEDYVYFETDIIGELARSKLKLHSVNSLTDALKANECLTINDKNSKCYRFHVQNTDGESYMLYTYGISKKLINAENRKRLDLADYQKFLLEYIELEHDGLLPLGITIDGRYVGKDIFFGNKSNDHIFITGQSGKGKSFCATNLLPLLAMLGSRMLVCDVSDSFTRDEVLRALPEEVVNALFEFIEVAAGKRKLPINPLFIGDCSGLPAKKRRIVGFIKAIAGKLDKDENRTLTGIISDMLKRQSNVASVTTEMLRNALKRGGKVGNHIYSLISSTLDDIDNIGFEEQGWGEFFENTKKIPVLSFGNESGDNVHSLLDAMIASAFEWQRDHDTSPLTVVVDEIKDQNFAEGSPLHTILTQGRKIHTKFIGMTQHYISTSSHAIDVVKEAGIKIFFKPSKSLDRIAAELRYKNPADAGFGSMGIGDIILSAELFNKEDGVNEPIVIHAKAIKFVETPLYKRFKSEYHLT